jgi:hypothetical protein
LLKKIWFSGAPVLYPVSGFPLPSSMHKSAKPSTKIGTRLDEVAHRPLRGSNSP